MPDVTALLPPLLAAAALSAVTVALPGRLLGRGRAAVVSVAWLVGVSAGFFHGAWLLGVRPNWPPREDQDRFLLVVFPALFGVELVAAVLRRTWVGWPLRLLVAAGAAPVLLQETIYVSDLAGPDSRLWSPMQTSIIFIILAVSLVLLWSALATLARRAPGRAIPVALALTCASAGVVVMLSAYASGGLLGLPLAASLLGATAGSLALGGQPDVRGAIGPAVVGLFALVSAGLFFGELTVSNAALLFFAPLLCCSTQLPVLYRKGPYARGLIQTTLVGCVLAVVLSLALRKFAEAPSAEPGSAAQTQEDVPW